MEQHWGNHGAVLEQPWGSTEAILGQPWGSLWDSPGQHHNGQDAALGSMGSNGAALG